MREMLRLILILILVILDVKTTETTHFCGLSPTDLSKEFKESSKERLMVDDEQRLPTQFERQIAIRNK